MSDAVDEEALEALEAKLMLVRDRVRGVAAGFHPGFYLWGWRTASARSASATPPACCRSCGSTRSTLWWTTIPTCARPASA
jgi:hypothetical protein